MLDTTPSQDGSIMDLDQRPPEADVRLQHSHPSPAPAHTSTAPPSAHHSPIPAPHQKPTLPPISGRPSPPASSRSREYSLPAQTPTTNGHRTNGPQLAYPSPSPQDVSMDALSRLQTQVQYNTASLNTQRRDFEALTHAVGRLSEDMVRMESLVVTLRKEILARPIAPAAPAQPGSNIDEAMIETFASNLTSVANKVSEVDALKMQLEIVKRRVKIMEEAVATAGPPTSTAPPPSAVPYASPREPSQMQPLHPMQHAPLPGHAPAAHHQAPPFHASPPVPRLGTPSHGELRPDLRPAPSVQAYHPATQEMHGVAAPGGQPGQPSQNSGWVSVNPAAKRQHPNGVDSPMDGRSETMGSPKRPKLAPLEPRVGPESAPASTPIRYDPVEREGRDYHAEAMREQQQYPAVTPTTFVPFTSTEQIHVEDNWHSEAHHGPSSAGKESRRGRGGGRGRGRRSLPADTRELGTPEWEKSGYQTGPEGYYHVEVGPNGAKLPRSGNLVRRGSGGNGPIAMRPIEMTRPTTSGDPYAHTKKTRTKPIRNADGILIRKDGRPDMRSQSSAANLRKVHARKEQERILEQRANTPSSSLATAPMSNDSQNGSQTAESTPDKENAPADDKDRHEAIMKQMFPNGVDDQVSRRNFHDQFFPGGMSPTVAKVKPEVTSPSERSISEVEEPARRRSQVNSHTRSPTLDAHEADKMDVSQDLAPQPVSQAA
ncbi:fe-s protein assembly co-chaperone protein [Diplodia corticola]|uniref:Fe-s protein assembly co-chaperone protein n=1 Tax=Diplodia corticola TaxID=236234 RepID=A0A1J9RR88_9PEZI|nr:fe-s protein assembly co-chaperone protein [Diplodia corticola]OJD30943.1 fe-s protein assembly co-chaperone protein [Diplodia corticola]